MKMFDHVLSSNRLSTAEVAKVTEELYIANIEHENMQWELDLSSEKGGFYLSHNY